MLGCNSLVISKIVSEYDQEIVIHYEIGVAVYKTQAFRNLEYNIEKAPADSIILQSKGLNLCDLFYCVGLRAPRKNKYLNHFL